MNWNGSFREQPVGSQTHSEARRIHYMISNLPLVSREVSQGAEHGMTHFGRQRELIGMVLLAAKIGGT